MLGIGSRCFLAGAMAVLGLTVAAQATPTIQLLSNTGVWRVHTTVGASTSDYSQSVADPYGAAPLPVVTPITNGVKLTFAPSADFLAQADNTVGTERQTFDGELSFLVTFDSPVHLTTNLYEDGFYQTTGNGVTNVTGTVTVSDFNGVESPRNSFFPVASASNHYWSLFDQVTGFSGAYTTYKISLDNVLEAQAFTSQTSSSALIAKKDFTLILTTDVPEPATLGVLAVGSLALIARRRRA
jgi:hypothetical protein